MSSTLTIEKPPAVPSFRGLLTVEETRDFLQALGTIDTLFQQSKELEPLLLEWGAHSDSIEYFCRDGVATAFQRFTLTHRMGMSLYRDRLCLTPSKHCSIIWLTQHTLLCYVLESASWCQLLCRAMLEGDLEQAKRHLILAWMGRMEEVVQALEIVNALALQHIDYYALSDGYTRKQRTSSGVKEVQVSGHWYKSKGPTPIEEYERKLKAGIAKIRKEHRDSLKATPD